MKKLFFILFISFVLKGNAQNKDYVIDMNGIGALKIGIPQVEIEKIIKQKLFLKNALDTAISWQDSATAKYKNITLLLFFQRQYTADNVYYMYLIGISTRNSLCKTVRGIGIGDDKLKVTEAYKKDDIEMGPEYDDQRNAIKNKYIITLNNHSGKRMMVFYLRNKKVVEIKVKMVFTDEE